MPWRPSGTEASHLTRSAAFTLVVLTLLVAVPAMAAAPPVVVLTPVPPGECTGSYKGSIALDASGSFDPDGAPLTFTWTAPVGVTFSNPSSATPIATAFTGNRTATLAVSDGSSTTSVPVYIDIRDTVAPGSYLRVDGTRLSTGWYYRGAQAYSIGTDACDGQPCGMLKLTGSSNLVTQCGGAGLYAPGTWNTEHWAQDFSGNLGPHTNDSQIVVVYNFRSTLSVPSPRILDATIVVGANFDGNRAVPNATIAGQIYRVGVAGQNLNLPFGGTTGADGFLRYQIPTLWTLPGDYLVQTTTSAFGLSHASQTTYRISAV